jgi:hypothetical protein
MITDPEEASMNAVLALLVIGLIVVLGGAVALLLLAVHIHSEEHRQALSQAPRTRGGALARRVLSAHSIPCASGRRARD